MTDSGFYRVAVDAPLQEALTYLPPESHPSLKRGDSVTVPLGRRTVKGLIVDQTNEKGPFELKQIKEILDQRPRLNEPFLRWIEWLSDYYMHPMGQVAASAFPPLKKGGKARKKNPLVPEVSFTPPPRLMPEQEKCFRTLAAQDGFHVNLLHGVTGSGKTEVYLHLLDEVLKRGQKGIVLVPEISLTPQLLQRFAARFQNQVAVIHSHLTEREKTNQWWEMIDGNKKILIGARSALFCPIKNLGVIIIDEEHEPSFKQDEKLRYHARDAAIMLAKFHNCPIVLGSATPSLESWNNALQGKYHLHQMQNRVADRKMPEIAVVDMREARDARKDQQESHLPFWISQTLYNRISETLDRKEQVALFLNRRGVAQLAVCPACGFIYECPNCAISLTLHGNNHLVCHYCDYADSLKDRCPQCPDGEVRPLGLGTELLEQDMARMFPEARIARADRDEISSREDLEDLIADVEERRLDVLIGTQMIAKGLDFPGLTLVGLVMADVGFNMPDFRSSERSFQLLTQMAGRSGRHSENPGQVVIQTYNPSHLSILYTRKNDYEGFSQAELEFRRELHYPPFGRLAMIKVQGIHFEKAQRAADILGHRAMSLKKLHQAYEQVVVLGPCQSPIAKLRNKYRHQLLLKGSTPQILKSFCKQLLGDLKWTPPGTKVQIDIDPMNML